MSSMSNTIPACGSSGLFFDHNRRTIQHDSNTCAYPCVPTYLPQPPSADFTTRQRLHVHKLTVPPTRVLQRVNACVKDKVTKLFPNSLKKRYLQAAAIHRESAPKAGTSQRISNASLQLWGLPRFSAISNAGPGCCEADYNRRSMISRNDSARQVSSGTVIRTSPRSSRSTEFEEDYLVYSDFVDELSQQLRQDDFDDEHRSQYSEALASSMNENWTHSYRGSTYGHNRDHRPHIQQPRSMMYRQPRRLFLRGDSYEQSEDAIFSPGSANGVHETFLSSNASCSDHQDSYPYHLTSSTNQRVQCSTSAMYAGKVCSSDSTPFPSDTYPSRSPGGCTLLTASVDPNIVENDRVDWEEMRCISSSLTTQLMRAGCDGVVIMAVTQDEASRLEDTRRTDGDCLCFEDISKRTSISSIELSSLNAPHSHHKTEHPDPTRLVPSQSLTRVPTLQELCKSEQSYLKADDSLSMNTSVPLSAPKSLDDLVTTIQLAYPTNEFHITNEDPRHLEHRCKDIQKPSISLADFPLPPRDSLKGRSTP